MKNKKVCLGLIVIAIIATLLGCIISYANNNETVYVNLTKLDTNGVGYGIGILRLLMIVGNQQLMHIYGT